MRRDIINTQAYLFMTGIHHGISSSCEYFFFSVLPSPHLCLYLYYQRESSIYFPHRFRTLRIIKVVERIPEFMPGWWKAVFMGLMNARNFGSKIVTFSDLWASGASHLVSLRCKMRFLFLKNLKNFQLSITTKKLSFFNLFSEWYDFQPSHIETDNKCAMWHRWMMNWRNPQGWKNSYFSYQVCWHQVDCACE